MSQTPIHRGTVDERGRVVFDDRQRWTTWLRSLAGKRVEIIARKHVQHRSSQQNRWYFGVIVPMVADVLRHATGNQAIRGQQAHEFLKSVFLGTIPSPFGPIPRSTRVLTVEEFSTYCTAIQSHAATEWQTTIPGPGESEPEFYEEIDET